MLSAFVSCEFGFGMEITDAQLQSVNAIRLGQKYKDESAAIAKRGTSQKQPLTMSPFVLEFEYGASAEGYWMYKSMVLQLEDCANVVKTLYPQYDFLFLFDHSCGHDKTPEDALKVENMNVGFGSKQATMRESLIKCERGYLGPHQWKIHVGDTQFMYFCACDEGPYWMTAAERERTRKDRYGDKVEKKNYTKDVLIAKLKEKGITAKGRADKIREMATAQNIPLQYDKREVVEGWEGKPKGMEQILWERGWIDVSQRRKDYTKLGTKDSMGCIHKETSLLYLISNCTDFEEEETMLQI